MFQYRPLFFSIRSCMQKHTIYLKRGISKIFRILAFRCSTRSVRGRYRKDEQIHAHGISSKNCVRVRGCVRNNADFVPRVCSAEGGEGRGENGRSSAFCFSMTIYRCGHGKAFYYGTILAKLCVAIFTIMRLRTTKNTARLSIFQTIEPCTDFTRCMRNRDKGEDRIERDRKRRRDNGEV